MATSIARGQRSPTTTPGTCLRFDRPPRSPRWVGQPETAAAMGCADRAASRPRSAARFLGSVGRGVQGRDRGRGWLHPEDRNVFSVLAWAREAPAGKRVRRSTTSEVTSGSSMAQRSPTTTSGIRISVGRSGRPSRSIRSSSYFDVTGDGFFPGTRPFRARADPAARVGLHARARAGDDDVGDDRSRRLADSSRTVL